MVILGGDSEIFTEENIVEIKKILEKVCPFVPEVVTSKLGADAPIIGGIKLHWIMRKSRSLCSGNHRRMIWRHIWTYY